MLTIHIPQATSYNQTTPNTSVELSPELRTALSARNVDPDRIEVESDGTITVQVDGGRIAIGEDDGWISANLMTDDGSETMIYQGVSVADLADAVARVAGQPVA